MAIWPCASWQLEEVITTVGSRVQHDLWQIQPESSETRASLCSRLSHVFLSPEILFPLPTGSHKSRKFRLNLSFLRPKVIFWVHLRAAAICNLQFLVGGYNCTRFPCDFWRPWDINNARADLSYFWSKRCNIEDAMLK